MTEEQEYLIHMNQRLSLVLGYAMGFVFKHGKTLTGQEREKYDWLIKAVENLVYLNKPLPPMP